MPTTSVATATVPSLVLDQPVLVANSEGVFRIDIDGTVGQLVAGPVAYAVDDTRGGLLFQVERGRQGLADHEGEPPSGRSTIIWWIPAGGVAPQELLVPTPGEGHYLSLHDAFATGDSFAVVYERHEGTVPFGSDERDTDDMADTLRVYDAATGTVNEIYRTRGYEWNLAEVTAGGGLVSATEVQILGQGCRLLNATSGEFVTSPGFPSATPACFDETADCAASCALSPTAARVAYDSVSRTGAGVGWEVSVADLVANTEVAQFSVRLSGRWSPAELDVDGDLVLLNRAWDGSYVEPALLVDIGDLDTLPIELPIAGRARFVTRPVDIAAPGPVAEQVWLATYRRDFPGYAIELIEIGTDDRIIVPTNRFDPFPQTVSGDGNGGIVIGSPFAHLPAAAHHPEMIVDTGIDVVAIIDGVPTGLYRTWEGESGWNNLIMWDDVTISLVAQPLDGEPATVLSAHSASRIHYATGEGEVGEPRPGGSAYGGGVLAVVWTTRMAGCSWLELRDGLSAEPAPVVNPWPAAHCDDGGAGVIDVAVTADGRILVAGISTVDEGPDLVAWDLTTGREIDRLPGVLHFEHDGNRRFAVSRRASGTEHQTALVEVTTDGFAVTPLPTISSPIGVITGELRLAPNATLTPAEAWTTCSTAGRIAPAAQDGLPAPVAATRDAIAAAVIECDLTALADLAIVSAEFRMVDAISYCDEPWPMSLQDDDVVHHWYAGDNSAAELTTLLDTLESPYRISDERYVWVGSYDYRIEIDASGSWVRNQRGFPPPECEGMECTC